MPKKCFMIFNVLRNVPLGSPYGGAGRNLWFLTERERKTRIYYIFCSLVPLRHALWRATSPIGGGKAASPKRFCKASQPMTFDSCTSIPKIKNRNRLRMMFFPLLSANSIVYRLLSVNSYRYKIILSGFLSGIYKFGWTNRDKCVIIDGGIMRYSPLILKEVKYYGVFFFRRDPSQWK